MSAARLIIPSSVQLPRATSVSGTGLGCNPCSLTWGHQPPNPAVSDRRYIEVRGKTCGGPADKRGVSRVLSDFFLGSRIGVGWTVVRAR